MALNKTLLSSRIKTLLDTMAQKKNKDEDTNQYMASELATIIDDYVKSQTITIAGVVTAGSPTAQTQTAPVQATIS